MQKVEVEKIIETKNPELARKVPRFVYRWLKKTIHQQELNDGLAKLSHLEGIDFADGVIDLFDMNLIIHGEDNLGAIDRPILVANHPLGGFDGVVLMSVVGRHFPELAVPANDILMHLKNLQSIFIPVNKTTRSGNSASLFQEALASQKAVIQFPAGMCSRKKGSVIRDLTWRRSFVVEGRKTSRPIVPVYISGENSWFFYTLAKVRKIFRISFNLEMLFLADEMFKQRGKTIHIVFGTPILPHEYSDGSTAGSWARAIKHRVYQLSQIVQAYDR